MLTLGVDLASQPANTGVCAVRWALGSAVVETLAVGAHDGTAIDDAWLMAAAAGVAGGEAPAKIAIDAPFGWPEPFVDAVARGALAAWPLEPGADRRPLERRLTDRQVHDRTGKLPLSVSTDRIAFPAMRCAALLGAWARAGLPVDRAGTGLACEAYPDPALRLLLPDLPAGPSYKGPAPTALARRDELVAALDAACDGRLRLTAEQRAACVAQDDALDALVCALVARAAARGLTQPPAVEEHAAAGREGWIHLPSDGVTLDDLLHV